MLYGCTYMALNVLTSCDFEQHTELLYIVTYKNPVRFGGGTRSHFLYITHQESVESVALSGSLASQTTVVSTRKQVNWKES